MSPPSHPAQRGPMSLQPPIPAPLPRLQPPQGHARPPPIPGAYPHLPSAPVQQWLNIPATVHFNVHSKPRRGTPDHCQCQVCIPTHLVPPCSTSSTSLPPVIPAPVARVLSPVGMLDHCDARHVFPLTQVLPCSSGPMSLGHAGPLPMPGCIPTYLVPPRNSGLTSLPPAPVTRVLSPVGAR
jgi:hypothetical protein